jgi:hypothetical protein
MVVGVPMVPMPSFPKAAKNRYINFNISPASYGGVVVAGVLRKEGVVPKSRVLVAGGGAVERTLWLLSGRQSTIAYPSGEHPYIQ